MDELLKTLAPSIASFLLGPIAGAGVKAGITFLADKFGATEQTKEGILQTIQGMTPADLLKAKELDYEFQEFCKKNDIQIQLAQISTNTEEAKSTNWFVAGWRPAVGWICVLSLFYAAIAEPFIRFVATVLFGYGGSFPVVDTNTTMQVLFGMLGLGAMRTYEKKTDSEHKR